MNAKRVLLGVMLTFTLLASAERHEPLDVTRIMWDLTSRKMLFESGNYCRIIPLQDGRLMAVAETYGAYGGITAAYSPDNGSTWPNVQPIVGNGNGVPVAVPDIIQLEDGTIMVCYNPRPSEPWSEERHFGIRCVRSTDNGETWSDPIYIYDAGFRGTEGCWEPAFLELPSGELHCYFANEHPYTGNNGDQEISMCRSFDKGLTWSDPVRVSYREGSRDGMPVPILTDNGEIVVIVEDNGHPGYHGFRATTMRCTLEQNWEDCWVDGTSDYRDMIFANEDDKNYVSAAPYIRKLPSGETIASWMGDFWGRKDWPQDRYDMYVGVGDKDGRNIGQLSQPFNVNADEHAHWNSVSVGFDNTVFAVASIGGSNGIYTMRGNAVRDFKANYGTPSVDGNFVKENWTCKNATQVLMGQYFRNRSNHDFLYDDENLYFVSYVVDRTPVNGADVNDGVQLSIDIDDISDTAPQKGIYTFFLNTNGKAEFAYGEGGEFHEAPTAEGVKYVANVKKTYYMLEVAIPWSVFGLDAAPVGRDMRVNVAVRDIRPEGYRNEVIPEAQPYSSYTWPLFRLVPKDGGSGIEEVETDAVAEEDGDAPEEFYNLQGMKVTDPTGGIFISRKGNVVRKVVIP